jgi:hypothetical protein
MPSHGRPHLEQGDAALSEAIGVERFHARLSLQVVGRLRAWEGGRQTV